MFNKETIAMDAKRVALTIESSTARVIIIISWYTEVRKIIMELARRNKMHFSFFNNKFWNFTFYTTDKYFKSPLNYKPMFLYCR